MKMMGVKINVRIHVNGIVSIFKHKLKLKPKFSILFFIGNALFVFQTFFNYRF